MNCFNFKCPHPNHSFSDILFVCLNPECSKNRKCCLLCVDESHQSHDIVSIQRFIQEINKNIQKNNKHLQKEELYKIINFTKATIKSEFQLFKNQLISSINKIQAKVNKYLETVHEVFSYNYEQTINNHIYKTFEQTDIVINEYIQMSEKAKNIEIGTLKQMKKILQSQSQLLIVQIYNSHVQIKALIDKLDKFAQKVKFYGKKYQTDFAFSDKNKAISIELADSKKTISRLIGTSNYTVCCLDKPFDSINNKFFVKINANPIKKIWLAACILEVVRKNNFVGCNGLGKGTYAIDQSSSSAYSYNNPNSYAILSNHHSANYNPGGYNMTTTAGWTFKEGDIIMVRINYEDDYIEFHLINQNFIQQDGQENQIFLQGYQMPIQFKDGEIYPFVGLNGMSGDQVTILSRQEIQKLITSFGNSWTQFDNFQLDLDDQESID